MMNVEDLIDSISELQRSDLERWIEAELVNPHDDGTAVVFTEVECARVRLICTLHYDLEIAADALPLVVSLIDQLYDSRQRFLALAKAVAQQDRPVRKAILQAALRNPEG